RAYAVSGGGCPQLHRRISSSRTTRYLSATYGGDDADQRTVPIPFVASRRPLLDADHPSNRGLFPRRSTPSSSGSCRNGSHRRVTSWRYSRTDIGSPVNPGHSVS